MSEELRPLLFSIAYRMLGSAGDAEDVVQEAFLRAERAESEGARIESDRRQQEELAERFMDAAENGELDRLVDFLAADVVFTGDGGGKGRGLPKPIYGRARVHRLLLGFFPRYREAGATMRRTEINGEPGVLFLDA